MNTVLSVVTQIRSDISESWVSTNSDNSFFVIQIYTGYLKLEFYSVDCKCIASAAGTT